MPHVRTHYDNLKVSRDAPIEVIRAAYKSLAAKHHPDLHPASDEADRIMRILNLAFEVLSDPAKRRQHDEWIARSESEPYPEAQHSPPPARPPSSSRPSDSTDASAKEGKWLRAAVIVTLAVVICGVALSLIPENSGGNSSASQSSTTPSAPEPEKTLTVSPEQLRPVQVSPGSKLDQLHAKYPAYSRPALAPNNQPWPVASGYLADLGQGDHSGNSTVAVDNRQNTSDMLVKLFTRQSGRPTAVRVFFLRAGERFQMKHVTPGSYDIRYQDLDSGTIWRSEPFALEESNTDLPQPHGRIRHRVHYTTFELTLYKVMDGNTRAVIIGPDEFQ